MSILKIPFSAQTITLGQSSTVYYYVCDTESERPTSGCSLGDLCFTKDSKKLWKYHDSSWNDSAGSQSGAAWGSITGTLSSQSDLQTVLDNKSDSNHTHTDVYEPANANIQSHIASAHAPANAEQNVNADWNSSSGDSQILNKPSLAQLHDRSHSITSSSDHTFPGGTTTFLRADGTFATPAGGSSPWTTVIKTADQSVTSSTVLVADSTLKVSMLANTRYIIKGRIHYNCGASADFKFRTAGPASPARVWIKRNAIIAGATAFGAIAVDAAYSAADVALAGTGTSGWIELDAIIENGTNAGDFEFRFAQNTSNGTPSSVVRGSYLEYATF